jgi:aminopeptidase N
MKALAFGTTCLLFFAISINPACAEPGDPAAAAGGKDKALYTADAPFEISHMRLELIFSKESLQARSCEGRVEYTIRPRATNLSTIKLDAVKMRILGVELNREEKKPAFSYDDQVLTVQLPKPVNKGETLTLVVKYSLADPPKGMHFILPNASQPKRPLMVYTMSEPLEARYWFPTHDWPNQHWPSDILVAVPAPYTAVANGVLVSKKEADDGKSRVFHYRHEVPTDPHLIGLAIGELVEQRDTWRGKPVTVFTQPGSEAEAKHTFRRVPEMLEFYTKLVGVDFPYPGYTHVTVVDHHHGGMEHAGFSFVAPRFLAASDDGDYPLEHTESNYLSHMLAHQWFGGMVNYRSVSQAWLNEGFAILLDSLWTSHTDSPHRFDCKMWETAKQIAVFDTSEAGKPMVNRDLPDPEDVYTFDGSKVYYKGGWVLQMLRHQLGEEVFWRAVAKYLNDHKGRGVETSDLRRSLEEVSGRDLEQFFQQWVYGHGIPRLEVDYAWDLAKKQAKVTVRQTQKIDASTPAFAFPLDLYFRAGNEDKTFTVSITEPRQELSFDFGAEPELFCVDPRGGVLKTLTTKLPDAMLTRQAANGPTALARLMAVEAIANQSSPAAIDALEQVLKNEAEFWMIRQAAADGLGKMQTDQALAALLRAEKKGISNPRALGATLRALGSYIISADAHTTVLKYAESPHHLYVEMAALPALAAMRASPELTEKSYQALTEAAIKSKRRVIRQSAVNALAAQDDPRSYDFFLDVAMPGQDNNVRGPAIAALGRLGRHEGLRDKTRTLLTRWLYDPDRPAQAAAIYALGTLGDPRSIADLERLRRSPSDDALRKAAKTAIEMIQHPQDPKQVAAGLIERLAVLEKQNQELEKRVKELAEKVEGAKEKTKQEGAGKGGG